MGHGLDWGTENLASWARSDADDFHSYKPSLEVKSKIVYNDMKHLALLDG